MPPLVTAQQVADSLGAAIAERADLDFLLEAASAAVEDHCGRVFAQAEVDELLDGTGTATILVSHPPIVAVLAIEVAGVPLSNADGTAWVVGGARITRGSGRGDPRCGPAWPIGTRNVRVQYTGGYLAVPRPVELATLLTIRHLADSAEHTGIFARERIGDYEYQRAATDRADVGVPLPAQRLLAPYVLPRYG